MLLMIDRQAPLANELSSSPTDLPFPGHLPSGLHVHHGHHGAILCWTPDAHQSHHCRRLRLRVVVLSLC